MLNFSGFLLAVVFLAVIVFFYSLHIGVFRNNLSRFRGGEGGGSKTSNNPNPETPISTLALGGRHSAFLTNNQLYTWGDDTYGQLGNGSDLTAEVNVPTLITVFVPSLRNGDKIVQIQWGDAHSAFLTQAGDLYTWGENTYSQLGQGSTFTGDTTLPTKITVALAGGDKIVQLSVGGYHSAFLTEAGHIYTWGDNTNGQLGQGFGFTEPATPTRIESVSPALAAGESIIQVAMGLNHSAFLTSAGHLYTWGRNTYGQLGHGNYSSYLNLPTKINFEDYITNVALGTAHTVCTNSVDQLYMFGTIDLFTKFHTPTVVNYTAAEGETIKQLAPGSFHSAFLTSAGRVFTWGWNNSGQLGDGSSSTNVTTTPFPINTFSPSLETGENIVQLVSGVNKFCAFLTSLDNVYTWGYDQNQQLGNGPGTSSVFIPTQIEIIS
jgi:alpha-tubulin suppressor-like RCC1 family protein